MANTLKKFANKYKNQQQQKSISPQLQQMQAQAKKQRMQQQGKATNKAMSKNSGNFMG